MSLDIFTRTCKNCTYYPCYKATCGEKCNDHMFEHEKIINKTEEKVGN